MVAKPKKIAIAHLNLTFGVTSSAWQKKREKKDIYNLNA